MESESESGLFIWLYDNRNYMYLAISGKGRAGSKWAKWVQMERKWWIKNISTMTQSKKLVETFEWTSTKYAVEYLNESVSSFGYSSLIFDLMYMYNRISSDSDFFRGKKPRLRINLEDSISLIMWNTFVKAAIYFPKESEKS